MDRWRWSETKPIKSKFSIRQAFLLLRKFLLPVWRFFEDLFLGRGKGTCRLLWVFLFLFMLLCCVAVKRGESFISIWGRERSTHSLFSSKWSYELVWYLDLARTRLELYLFSAADLYGRLTSSANSFHVPPQRPLFTAHSHPFNLSQCTRWPLILATHAAYIPVLTATATKLTNAIHLKSCGRLSTIAMIFWASSKSETKEYSTPVKDERVDGMVSVCVSCCVVRS